MSDIEVVTMDADEMTVRPCPNLTVAATEEGEVMLVIGKNAFTMHDRDEVEKVVTALRSEAGIAWPKGRT